MEKEKMHRARHGGRDQGTYTLQVHTTPPKSPCVHHCGSSPNPILFGFLWWLHYIVIIDLILLVIEFNLQPLSPSPSGQGMGLEVPTLSSWLTPSYWQHILGTLGKPPYLHNKRHLDCSHHSGNYKGFQNSMPEKGMKTKYIFLIINYNCTLLSCTASSPPGCFKFYLQNSLFQNFPLLSQKTFVSPSARMTLFLYLQ